MMRSSGPLARGSSKSGIFRIGGGEWARVVVSEAVGGGGGENARNV